MYPEPCADSREEVEPAAVTFTRLSPENGGRVFRAGRVWFQNPEGLVLKDFSHGPMVIFRLCYLPFVSWLEVKGFIQKKAEKLHFC